eukprot:TRINITY_DN5509_c0_g1_i3.p1 TRINITY_DN5509_c0_g1~~TRINITY_DN5509_c0_g1_i3.p1  ORF type:complete len:469 (+),score=121.91 TRINITY_DN5509_c0_g1_i3:68-1474(+)
MCIRDRCEKMVRQYGLTHISTGDLLRARKKDMPELAEFMDNGALVPDDLIVAIVKERIEMEDCQRSGYLLDGFPRTLAQAKAITDANLEVNHFVFLDVPDALIVKRIAGRVIDPVSGRIYHTDFNPPPEEVLPRVVRRADDTEEKIVRRLREFHAHMPSILSYYASIVKRVDGTNNDPLIIFDHIAQALEGDAYVGRRLAQAVVVKSYEMGTASTLLTTVAQYFEHSRWRMLYQRHLKTVGTVDDPKMTVKAQTIWLSDPDQLQRVNSRLRLEAWIEQFKTMSVTTGHSLVDPSTSRVIARASVAIATKERGVLPNRPQLEDLVDRDSTLPRMDESYERLCCEIDVSIEPEKSFPFIVGPCDMDMLSEMNQSYFIRYFEAARYQAFLKCTAGSISDFPAPMVMSLEYLNEPLIGSTVQVCLWGATFDPPLPWSGGDVLMEMRDVNTGKVYTRCAVEVARARAQVSARL